MTRKQTDQNANGALTHGSGGADAEMAADSAPVREDRHIEVPYAREAKSLEKGVKFDQLADRKEATEDRQEALLDEAIEETFPGSDPISPKHIT